MADPTALIIQMLQTKQRTNYLAAGAGALIAYDQVLTFAHEQLTMQTKIKESKLELYICLIPNRPVLWVSEHNIPVGLSLSLILIDSGLAAWIIRINWTYSGYVIMYLVVLWATNIFLLSMQAILVIRVYALLNRSKKVLVFLATCYTLQAAAVFVMTALEYNSRALHEYGQDSTIVSLVFDGILLSFALRAFVIHALEAKTLNRGWSVNVLVRTIVTDHLVYFVCNIIWLSLVIASKYLAEQNVFTTLAVLAGPRMV
ncbi:hypothetical protein BJ138DRAFT_1195599, partial [Hygrophoropsis aurantiaca]